MRRNANGQRPTKSDLPHKTCLTCNRPFVWRRKWRDCWDDVKYCSARCRDHRANNKGGASQADTAP
ncbi:MULTISPECIES: DUF2256 domain-containing protein [Thalassospira]|uniref:DUF2256 domain-containing protein n=2 Tax=Thalassospiraceae TaxID=2844866 RepID=UPI0009F367FB|nr:MULTISPECIES: DUF2256 domain-containing protein [Thalassospira]MAB31659.1 DUF2256 domain-containing protein [Thalassospira sp.]MBA05078.1 DUF2256 domain-containing protein [Thalassospira sp.]MDM7975618.1 DUF2256 domain-containing protein [Thalassospira xiamenensis]HBS24618.1 DUF2256 domain-containing protein [Thalassospira sp.]